MNESLGVVTKYQLGNERAYAELWKASHERLLAVAYRILRDVHEAQDAVQDTFLSMIRHVDRFRGDASIHTWLHSVVSNAARMRRRKKQRTPLPMSDELPEASPELVEGDSCPTTRAVRLDNVSRVRIAIAALDRTHREVLRLRALEQRSTEETARRLRITRTAVRARFCRARAALRKKLECTGGRPVEPPILSDGQALWLPCRRTIPAGAHPRACRDEGAVVHAS